MRELPITQNIAIDIGRYGNYEGLSSFRAQIADWLSSQTGNSFSIDNVVITAGAQAGLRLIHQVVRASGKRLLFPAGLEFPGANDPDGLSCHVGRYRSIQGSGDLFRPKLEMQSMCWDNVGASIISNPHNPTSAYWDKLTLTDLATAAGSACAFFVIDWTYAPPFAPLATRLIELPVRDNILHIFSFSKVGLAAARVGAIAGPVKMVSELVEAQRRQIIQPPLLGQLVAEFWMRSMQADRELGKSVGVAWEQRWKVAADILLESKLLLSGVRIFEWGGGPFLWCEWDGVSDMKVVDRLLRNKVAVAPATTFAFEKSKKGVSGLRIGLGASESQVRQGTKLVAQVLRSLL
jgi:aspartate aminotransferase